MTKLEILKIEGASLDRSCNIPSDIFSFTILNSLHMDVNDRLQFKT